MDKKLAHNPFKKVLNEVSAEMKVNAIEKLERGASVYDIATELNVHHTTVRLWIKKKNNLIHHTPEMTKSRKRFRKQRYNNINKAVWIWFKMMRASGTPVSGPMIKTKALTFSKKLNEENTFTASNGWLRSWKSHYGVH